LREKTRIVKNSTRRDEELRYGEVGKRGEYFAVGVQGLELVRKVQLHSREKLGTSVLRQMTFGSASFRDPSQAKTPGIVFAIVPLDRERRQLAGALNEPRLADGWPPGKTTVRLKGTE
jgi:hypothetical protein